MDPELAQALAEEVDLKTALVKAEVEAAKAEVVAQETHQAAIKLREKVVWLTDEVRKKKEAVKEIRSRQVLDLSLIHI